HDTLCNDDVALGETADDFDESEAAAADLDLLFACRFAVDAINVCAILHLEDGALGHDERLALTRDDLDREQHAGSQRAVVVRNQRTDRDCARYGIDARSDRTHGADEVTTREAHALGDDTRAGSHDADEG